MLLLFVAYYVDVNFFVHTHVIDGVTVVHSHIHADSHHATADGHHTTAQINLIASLSSQLLTIGILLGAVLCADYKLLRSIGAELRAAATSAHLRRSSLRAPPALTVA